MVGIEVRMPLIHKKPQVPEHVWCYPPFEHKNRLIERKERHKRGEWMAGMKMPDCLWYPGAQRCSMIFALVDFGSLV